MRPPKAGESKTTVAREDQCEAGGVNERDKKWKQQRKVTLFHKSQSRKKKHSGGLLFYFVFLGPNPQHMEVPRAGGQIGAASEVYTTATATPDPSSICDLCHSL